MYLDPPSVAALFGAGLSLPVSLLVWLAACFAVDSASSRGLYERMAKHLAFCNAVYALAIWLPFVIFAGEGRIQDGPLCQLQGVLLSFGSNATHVCILVLLFSVDRASAGKAALNAEVSSRWSTLSIYGGVYLFSLFTAVLPLADDAYGTSPAVPWCYVREGKAIWELAVYVPASIVVVYSVVVLGLVSYRAAADPEDSLQDMMFRARLYCFSIALSDGVSFALRLFIRLQGGRQVPIQFSATMSFFAMGQGYFQSVVYAAETPAFQGFLNEIRKIADHLQPSSLLFQGGSSLSSAAGHSGTFNVQHSPAMLRGMEEYKQKQQPLVRMSLDDSLREPLMHSQEPQDDDAERKDGPLVTQEPPAERVFAGVPASFGLRTMVVTVSLLVGGPVICTTVGLTTFIFSRWQPAQVKESLLWLVYGSALTFGWLNFAAFFVVGDPEASAVTSIYRGMPLFALLVLCGLVASLYSNFIQQDERELAMSRDRANSVQIPSQAAKASEVLYVAIRSAVDHITTNKAAWVWWLAAGAGIIISAFPQVYSVVVSDSFSEDDSSSVRVLIAVSALFSMWVSTTSIFAVLGFSAVMQMGKRRELEVIRSIACVHLPEAATRTVGIDGRTVPVLDISSTTDPTNLAVLLELHDNLWTAATAKRSAVRSSLEAVTLIIFGCFLLGAALLLLHAFNKLAVRDQVFPPFAALSTAALGGYLALLLWTGALTHEELQEQLRNLCDLQARITNLVAASWPAKVKAEMTAVLHMLDTVIMMLQEQVADPPKIWLVPLSFQSVYFVLGTMLSTIIAAGLKRAAH